MATSVSESPVVTALRNADEGTLAALAEATGLEQAELTRELVGLVTTLDDPEPADGLQLPDTRPGYGFVVIEAPLELVAVFNTLHPSDAGTAAAQMAGHMRESLVEMRKMPPRMGATPMPDDRPVAVAVVSASSDTLEANAR